ncbi:MAG: helix-hairpin-helix domain-containing protein [Bacillota bacterium]
MININKSTIKKLIKIKGIGKSKAKKIIEYRNKNGFFKKKRDIKNVKGIGDKIFDKIRDKIEVGKIDNKVKVEFRPSDYNLYNLNEAHLVGTINDWDPGDKSYSLKKNEDGLWVGEFDLNEGDEYKIMYDSSSWEEDKYIGDLDSQNIVVKK